MRKLIVLVILLLIFLAAWNAITENVPEEPKEIDKSTDKIKIIDEESVVIDVVEKVSPSVVTVGVERRIIDIDPFGRFRIPEDRSQEQDIGSGFIVSKDGLIVTNKHVVVSSGKYKVIIHDGKKYDVVSIYRDPANDLAIIKIDGDGLVPVEMGDSSKVKVGQVVVAIGTPLGEFRGSVTKGIVSGLGRGINAGSPFEGFVERLDDVIQTDAAINPGNSGGPLVNSSGQVIGINTAIASGAENIGFAIPINVVKEALENFDKTGGFIRPYLGVSYTMIDRRSAILNEVPEGAYIEMAAENTAADAAGIEPGDIITRFDGQRVNEENSLAGVISKKKVGDNVEITVWREGETLTLNATLGTAPNQ